MAIFMFQRFFTYPKFAKHGIPLEAKIIGYETDYSMRVNGRPVKDLIVRYWDDERNRVEEVTINTNISGTKKYRTGCSIWIYRLDDDYVIASKSYDKVLEHEDEIMNYHSSVPSCTPSHSGGYIQNPNETMTSQPGSLHGVICPCCGNKIMIDERWRPVGFETTPAKDTTQIVEKP